MVYIHPSTCLLPFMWALFLNVFVRLSQLAFPVTQIGCSRERALAICNPTQQEQVVLVDPPPHPFSTQHRQVSIHPRSYVMLPVFFHPGPEQEGPFALTMGIRFQNEYQEECRETIKLFGEASRSCLRVGTKYVMLMGAHSSVSGIPPGCPGFAVDHLIRAHSLRVFPRLWRTDRRKVKDMSHFVLGCLL